MIRIRAKKEQYPDPSFKKNVGSDRIQSRIYKYVKIRNRTKLIINRERERKGKEIKRKSRDNNLIKNKTVEEIIHCFFVLPLNYITKVYPWSRAIPTPLNIYKYNLQVLLLRSRRYSSGEDICYSALPSGAGGRRK